MAKYDPYAIRRCVRQTVEIEGTHGFVTKSFTKSEGEYHPVIGTESGQWECDCPDWMYRKRRTGEPCKHIRRALAQLARKGLL